MTVTEVLRTVAHHVEEHKAALVWDGPEMPSDEEKARLIAEVSKLGHEIDSLAAASETARIYPREYEAIRDELQRRGFTLPPEIAQAVADVFQAERLANAPPSRRSLKPRTSTNQP